MKTFDRYVLRSFLKTYFLWFFCFIGLYVVFDLFTHADNFARAGSGLKGTLMVIGRHYMVQSIPFFDKISPLLCLTSAIVTIAMMMRNNELVPVLAAGVSSLRVVRPIIFAVFLLTIGTTVSREVLLPQFLGDLQADPSKYTEDDGTEINAAVDYQSRIRIQGKKAYFVDSRISSPNFKLSKALSVYGKELTAENAFYLPKDATHPAGYLMKNVQQPQELLSSPTLTFEERPIVITPQDADWLEPTDCFVISGVPFNYLAANEMWRSYASTWDYISAMRGQSLYLGRDIETMVHTRIVQPFLDMTLLFLGLPIILKKGDRNVFKALGIVALIVILFLFVQFSAIFFGRNSDMPILGAWFPLFLFVPIAVKLYMNVEQ